jgi:hypothetical protein
MINTLYVSDLASLQNAITLYEDFEKFSGLKLNLNKTEIIPIGKTKYENF